MLLWLFVQYQRAKRVMSCFMRPAKWDDARFAEAKAYDSFGEELKSAKFWAFRRP
jgi:hypothetical protein